MLPTGMQLSFGKVANYWLVNYTHAHEFLSVPFFLIKKSHKLKEKHNAKIIS